MRSEERPEEWNEERSEERPEERSEDRSEERSEVRGARERRARIKEEIIRERFAGGEDKERGR